MLRSGIKQLIDDRNTAKAEFDKGSIEELTLKTAVNSVYGKTAQDVAEQRAWDAFAQEMDADVLVAEGVPQEIRDLPVVQGIPVVAEGRTLFLGEDFTTDFAGALGFNSPLSIPLLLEIAVPRLAAATDDDPETSPEPYPER